MGTTTIYYDVVNIATSGLLIPLIISIVASAWLIGILIKAMKSKDLV